MYQFLLHKFNVLCNSVFPNWKYFCVFNLTLIMFSAISGLTSLSYLVHSCQRLTAAVWSSEALTPVIRST